MENQLEVDAIDGGKNYTVALWEKALGVFHTHLFTAQLPPEMEADAIRPRMHQKPRVVLITDYVEELFINAHLPNRRIFEFKVYSLNPTVFGAYKGKVDAVIDLDPDDPGQIPMTRDGSEPIKKEKMEPHKFPSVPFLVSIIVGSVVTIFTLVILFLFCRVRRLNWLNKLEKFKTEHLFQAYQKSQQEAKDRNCVDLSLEQWEMRWDQLSLNWENLGRGMFGAVHKATLTSLAPNWPMASSNSSDKKQRRIDLSQTAGIRAGTQVAVKMLSPERASTKRHQIDFLHEIEIMKMLGCHGKRCVVRMLGCMSRMDGTLGLVLEYCPGGNLLEHVQQIGSIGFEAITKKEEEGEKATAAARETLTKKCRQFAHFAWQICDGMLFLGTKHLVHRDLAARNVLLDAEPCAKIADFGLCICLEDEGGEKDKMAIGAEGWKSKCGLEDNDERLPIRWLAPECLASRKFSQKSDLWSFGILLHEMFTFGRNPFEGVDNKDLLAYMQNQQTNYMRKPEVCPDEIYAIMQKCLILDPVERPNFAQIQAELTAFLEQNSAEYGYLQLNL